MIPNPVRVCRQCVCPSTMPNIVFDDDGVCSECRRSEPMDAAARAEALELMERAFERLGQWKHPYQVLVMLSGGKDSTYVLHLMKNRYNLRPIACQIIHPFVNELARDNARDVAEALGVDLIQFKADQDVWRRALSFAYREGRSYGTTEMFGCGVCSELYHTVGTKLALHLGVGCMVDGYDRALDPDPILVDPDVFRTICLEGCRNDPIKALIHDALAERHAGSIYDPDFSPYARSQFPGRVAPLTVLDHDHTEIVRELDELGLLSKTRSRSDETNCDLFHLWSYIGFRRHHCHPYVRAISQALRQDKATYLDQWMACGNRKMDRDETLRMLDEYERALSYAVSHPDATEAELAELGGRLPGMSAEMGGEQLLRALKRATRMKELAEYLGLDWSDVVRGAESSAHPDS